MLSAREVKILNDEIISTRSLFIAILVIVIIFILLTFGFIYYPLYLMNNKVTDITQQSKDALNSLKDNVSTGESTLQGINAATQQVSDANSTIHDLIANLCSRSPFNGDAFCHSFK